MSGDRDPRDGFVFGVIRFAIVTIALVVFLWIVPPIISRLPSTERRAAWLLAALAILLGISTCRVIDRLEAKKSEAKRRREMAWSLPALGAASGASLLLLNILEGARTLAFVVAFAVGFLLVLPIRQAPKDS